MVTVVSCLNTKLTHARPIKWLPLAAKLNFSALAENSPNF